MSDCDSYSDRPGGGFQPSFGPLCGCCSRCVAWVSRRASVVRGTSRDGREARGAASRLAIVGRGEPARGAEELG